MSKVANGKVVAVPALTGVSQAQSPETQVRRGVGDAAQAVLDGVNGLVQEHIRKVKLQNKPRNISGIILSSH